MENNTLRIIGFEKKYSYFRAPTTILYDADLDPSSKIIYYALLQRSQFDNDTFVSISKIAKDVGTSTATVKRRLRQLSAYGLIKVISRKNKNGGDTSNVYQIVHPASVYGEKLCSIPFPSSTEIRNAVKEHRIDFDLQQAKNNKNIPLDQIDPPGGVGHTDPPPLGHTDPPGGSHRPTKNKEDLKNKKILKDICGSPTETRTNFPSNKDLVASKEENLERRSDDKNPRDFCGEDSEDCSFAGNETLGESENFEGEKESNFQENLIGEKFWGKSRNSNLGSGSSVLMKNLMKDSAEAKQVVEKSKVGNKWTRGLKYPKKNVTEAEFKKWELTQAKNILHKVYKKTMLDMGFHPLGDIAENKNRWGNFFRKMNGSLEEVSTFVEWLIRNWNVVLARHKGKIKTCEPSVKLLTSEWVVCFWPEVFPKNKKTASVVASKNHDDEDYHAKFWKGCDFSNEKDTNDDDDDDENYHAKFWKGCDFSNEKDTNDDDDDDYWKGCD